MQGGGSHCRPPPWARATFALLGTVGSPCTQVPLQCHYYLGHDHAPPPLPLPRPTSCFSSPSLWYPSEFPAPCPALNPHRYGTFRIQFGQFFGLCPVGVFVNDPASVKHILQTGFQSGAYGKGPFFKLQYKV